MAWLGAFVRWLIRAPWLDFPPGTVHLVCPAMHGHVHHLVELAWLHEPGNLQDGRFYCSLCQDWTMERDDRRRCWCWPS